jgi:predicted acyl esterase
MVSRVTISVTFVLMAIVAMLVVPPASSPATAAVAAQDTPWPGGLWEPDPASYGMTVQANVPVKMSDGATLVANIGYPTDLSTGQQAAATFPVLLTQDPYVGASQQPQAFYVTRGYINAVVEQRGTGDTSGSGGKEVALDDTFGPRLVQDGVELVHWAARLPASNGTVGLDGCSALGVIQLFTAAAVGPHSPLKEILPSCAEFGYDNEFAGGVPDQLIGLTRLAASAVPQLYGSKNATATGAAAVDEGTNILAGGPSAYDGPYWQTRTTYNVVPKIVANGIPALLYSGWYAHDGEGSLEEYAIFQNAYDHRPPDRPMSSGQRTTGRYQVVIGPWMHGKGLDDSIQLEWYDTWLKGENTRITDTRTPMHLGALEGDSWVNAAVYPIADGYTAYHLDQNATLRTSPPTSPGSAQLAWGPPAQIGTTVTFDAPDVRNEELVAGPIAATLYARSSNRNIDLIATLSDVGADNQTTEIASGNIVGSLRAVNKDGSWYDKHGLMVYPDHPFLTNQYAPANSVQRYDIQLPPTLYSLSPGHHLELELSTQPPQSDCGASLTAALGPPVPCDPSRPQRETLPGGVYLVVWSPSMPSSVNLPLLSPDALPVAKSATTPTSEGMTEPIDWSSTAP